VRSFANAFANLTDNYLYDWNLVNTRITEVDDVNFSDDELMFMSYLGWAWCNSSLSSPQFASSLQRSWNLVRPYRNPFYWAVAWL
jgi:hypothetical protein